MKKNTELNYLCLFLTAIRLTNASDVFHFNTRIKFEPADIEPGDYFGYSTLLSPKGVFIGAPKAFNTNNNAIKTGLLYYCSLKNITIRNITCNKMDKKLRMDNKRTMYFKNQDLKEDSWFGSSIALIKDSLLVTAPRLTSTSTYDGSLSLLQGAAYIINNVFRCVEPLNDHGNKKYQLFTLDGSEPSYGKNDTDTYYYSLGQFGFSVAVSKMNTLIFGAPGLLKSAGGIISYTFNTEGSKLHTNVQPITNPYYTDDLDPDDNFGYSVDSGTFEVNGSVLYVGGAPRAELARGKVLVIAGKDPKFAGVETQESNEPLKISYNLTGPQVGSYFGASLCCTDIDGDGRDDLLVGAPTFVEKKDGSLPYDQGAVFIYMTREADSGFELKPSGYVSGDMKDGARFGTTIVDLGDVDGDTFRDIAIGAPWEDNGKGAVYIYMGCKNGLNAERMQKIQQSEANGFGFSISKGFDVDGNSCNDLLVGAFNSSAAYLYRCIPTMKVIASIRVDNKLNLPVNATSFTAMFCVSSPPMVPNVKLGLKGTIKSNNQTIGEPQYPIIVSPGKEICNEKTITVDIKADLFNPIILNFELIPDEIMKDNATTFMMDAARLSNNSEVNVTLPIQLMRDCGDDLICSPWLNISMDALDNPYVPGSTNRLGIKLSAMNLEEPAYGLKIIFTFPLHPKRIPRECTLEELEMICNLPQPFERKAIVDWEFEIDYNLTISLPTGLTVKAEASDTYHRSNISVRDTHEVSIDVIPEATFTLTGKSLPTETMNITRDDMAAGTNVTFQHLFAITNRGPSDWNNLTVNIWLPEKAYLTSDIEGCEQNMSVFKCQWSIPAKVSFPVTIAMMLDLGAEANYFKRYMWYNATTSVLIQQNNSKSELKFIGYEVTTTIMLEPADLLWCIVVPCVFLGLLLLVVIIRILHKCGFFQRSKRQKIKKLEMGTQHSYRTIHTSDTDRSSQPDKDDENLDTEENSEININISMNRSSYHATDKT